MDKYTNLEPLLKTLKKKSNYHFDNTIQDKRGEWFWVLGKFNNIWETDLSKINETLRPLSWESIRTTLGRDEPNPRLLQQEADIVAGGGNPKMTLTDINDQLDSYPAFQRMIRFFKLDQPKSRLHIQRTGQVFNYHIDTFESAFPKADPKDLVRVVVMLEDWEPGQFYMYGNCTYDRWTAGEFHWFDWQNVPHATANSSSKQRPSLIITGIRTTETDKILKKSGYTYYNI